MQNNITASSLKIRSFNVNSIGKKQKRQQVFHALKKKQNDIFILVDTRIEKSIENIVKCEWDGPAFFSSFNSQSRGVAILFNKNCPFKLNNLVSDDDGNFLSIDFEYNSKNISLTGIYGPNSDDPSFYTDKVFPIIENSESDFCIIGGDWNFTLNQNLDNYNYLHVNNTGAKNVVNNKIQSENLCDIWRELNPNKKQFTWIRKNPLKMARLDFFLISSQLSPFVSKSSIEPSIYSDHSIIFLELDFSRVRLGKGFFKFNNSLLKDNNYINLVKRRIKNVTRQYAENTLDDDFWNEISRENIDSAELSINPQLFFEVLLMEIRGLTIGYSSQLKRAKNLRYSELLRAIEEKELQFHANPDDNDVIDSLQNLKSELENLNNILAQGAAIRARAMYHLDGEAPTRYFCNLEKVNNSQKYISCLKIIKNDKESILSEQRDIESEIFEFYKELYKNKDSIHTNSSIGDYLSNCAFAPTSLTDYQRTSLEGYLTQVEVAKYLKKLRNNKTPGSTGFTGEFYKFFWPDFKNRLVDSINYSFDLGTLPNSQKLGIITLIPKGDKDKTYLKNYRPLTMLNTYYKIISGCIAERLKPVLQTIISENQKAYLPDRYIGEVTRTTYDILHAAKDNNIPGVLLLIDFEKCFDSVSHKFIKKCLDFFNFGADIKRWISLLLDEFSASINHVGNISPRFKISRGVKQGDPISGYLFLICAEILAHRLKHDPRIEGFQVSGLRNSLEQYADDLQVFLKAFENDRLTEKNIRNAVNALLEFQNISGLKPNMSKTYAVWFGSKSESSIELCQDLDMKWTREFESLGIHFDNKLERMDRNLEKCLESIKKVYKNWQHRHLTPFGKITVIKTLILSKLTHLVLVIPSLEKKLIDTIEKDAYRFLWNNKPNQVSKKYCMLECKRGGLNMTSIEDFWYSIKASWLRRATYTNSFWLKLLESEISKNDTNLNEIFCSGNTKSSILASKLNNTFWREVFHSCSVLLQKSSIAHSNLFLLFPLIQNSLFKVGHENIEKNLFNGQYLQVADVMKENTYEFLELGSFNARHRTNLNFLQYLSLKNSIIAGARKINHNIGLSTIFSNPRPPHLYSILLANKKGCQYFYKIFIYDKRMQINTSIIEEKWHNELNTVNLLGTWDKRWALYSNIKYFNELKWLQYRILHRSLKTNKIVSKFIHNVSETCSLCNSSIETLTHLFFHCPKSYSFWTNVKDLCQQFNITLNVQTSNILFGDTKLEPSSPINLIILFGKQYIWSCKYRNQDPLLHPFKFVLINNIKVLKSILLCKDDLVTLQKWNTIHDILQENEDE